MSDDPELVHAVINLHTSARIIERKLGKGPLSETIRECAIQLDKILETKDDIQQDKRTEGSGP